ncbi:inner membrane protein [Pseudomonas fluvialis]|uniref:Inner membrane protein n=1 Tax=Pseudomonas fluvialis TaxID=1793966 RepID=A0A7X0ET23_9PSED|nr:metal-dependent hydrolase [Pseudomonas fluvialis]MBB6340161.1 inner membrane protein [Pseudomonas fluvialis]
MTTLITHPLPALALGLALGSRVIPPRLLWLGAIAACLPDADMLAFRLGIAYQDVLGHRGFSHSLLFAGLCGILAMLACRGLRCRPLTALLWVSAAVGSHSLLDAMTNGGLGVAWLWPWDAQRYFLPWRPIEVSPFLHGFFTPRGLAVLASEWRWVWQPCLAISATVWLLRLGLQRLRSGKPQPAVQAETEPPSAR